MSVASQPYRRLLPHEEDTLEDWGFLQDYARYHQQLVLLMQGAFIALCRRFGRRPTEDEFYQLYWEMLLGTDLFTKDMAGTKYRLTQQYYAYFAQLLTKYVMREDESIVRRIQC